MNRSNANLTFSYVNDEINLDSSDKRKTIRMSSKGFCIAIISDKKEPLRLFQYSFASENVSIEDKCKVITDTDQELNILCGNNFFRLYTQYNVQIPEEFYEQKNDEAILSLIIENSEQYTPFAECIEPWTLYNISAWKKELHSVIRQQFSNYESGTVLSSLLNIVAQQKHERKSLIFVEDNNFTVIAIDNGQLLGANTFSFFNENDFLYYSCAFLRKMYKKPAEVPLKLCGNIAPQSSLYTILNKYFSIVEMLSSPYGAIDNYSYFCDLFE